jgi:hypothetical protein
MTLTVKADELPSPAAAGRSAWTEKSVGSSKP